MYYIRTNLFHNLWKVRVASSLNINCDRHTVLTSRAGYVVLMTEYRFFVGAPAVNQFLTANFPLSCWFDQLWPLCCTINYSSKVRLRLHCQHYKSLRVATIDLNIMVL